MNNEVSSFATFVSDLKGTVVEGGATRGTTALVIDNYIAAYIQVQYRVIRVHPTGLTVARGVGMCPHGRCFSFVLQKINYTENELR